MTYVKLNIMVRIDGVVKFFEEMSAISIDAALNDIRAAYWGDVELIQYGQV